jgi:hypothetical protein
MAFIAAGDLRDLTEKEDLAGTAMGHFVAAGMIYIDDTCVPAARWVRRCQANPKARSAILS